MEMTKTQMKVGLAVLAVGLLASVTSASAGYRHGHAYYNSYPNDYSYSYNGGNGYSESFGSPNYQSDEIRELRRAFPSTNWPPSDRY
jgi:hypothetical protein